MVINVFHQIEENMVALKRETGLKEVRRKPQDPAKFPKPKFRVLGEEMIEKEVKPSGNSGRVYLPLNWVGKHVKIIRID
jgi:putative transposon-encoded protein